MWYCNNPKCEKYNEEVEVNTIDFPYIVERERVKRMTCPICGQRLQVYDEYKDSQHTAIMKFDSLSDAEKKKIMKKRADWHYNKYEKERCQAKKRQVINQMVENFKNGR